MKPKRLSPERAQKRVDDFNRANPIGATVRVDLDCGTMQTLTRSAAWLLGGHTPVILCEGISGCYDLDRITALVVAPKAVTA